MINKAVARRYSHALFLLAQEKDILDRVQDDLSTIVGVINENSELREVIEHRLIPVNEKKELVQKAFSSHILKETMNFIQLLLDKKRENYLPEIFEQYQVFADEARNLYRAEVTAAAQLSSKDLEALESKLSKLTGKNVKAEVNVDPSLIGGVIVKLGDQVIDGSVVKRLEMMKQNLKSINFTVSGVN